MHFLNLDNIRNFLIVWTLNRPMARGGRKQNGDIPILNFQSRYGAAKKWRWKSVKNLDGKMIHFAVSNIRGRLIPPRLS
jgi:hypothetical protein